jgi:hypothetical protein
MSRTGRVLVIVAAWIFPVAWVAGALLAGPSDGTVVSTPALGGDARWGQTVTVVEVVEDGPLQVGDVVREVDGRPWGDWVVADSAPDRRVGETVRYEVRRPAPDLDRILNLEVTLVEYPAADALVRHAATVVAAILLLLAASVVFWRRPGRASSGAFLLAAALLPARLTATAFGLGAIDLAGARGPWPHLVGELLCTIGVGAAVVAALTFPTPPSGVAARPWTLAPMLLTPFLGYFIWLAGPGGGGGHPAPPPPPPAPSVTPAKCVSCAAQNAALVVLPLNLQVVGVQRLAREALADTGLATADFDEQHRVTELRQPPLFVAAPLAASAVSKSASENQGGKALGKPRRSASQIPSRSDRLVVPWVGGDGGDDTVQAWRERPRLWPRA